MKKGNAKKEVVGQTIKVEGATTGGWWILPSVGHRMVGSFLFFFIDTSPRSLKRFRCAFRIVFLKQEIGFQFSFKTIKATSSVGIKHISRELFSEAEDRDPRIAKAHCIERKDSGQLAR